MRDTVQSDSQGEADAAAAPPGGGGDPGGAPESSRQGPPHRPASGFNWKRFWIQSLILIAIFNIAAGLITWYFILPRLHPAQ